MTVPNLQRPIPLELDIIRCDDAMASQALVESSTEKSLTLLAEALVEAEISGALEDFRRTPEFALFDFDNPPLLVRHQLAIPLTLMRLPSGVAE